MSYQSSTSLPWDSGVLEGQLFKNLTKYSLLLQKLTTSSQVNKLLKLINKDHVEQLGSLDVFIQESQLKHNKSVRKLELQRTDLTTTLSNYHTALTTISDSNVIAKTINTDIITIDNEDKLVTKTLDFVNQIKILKQNISIINTALESKEYLLAAKAIQEIRKLPKDIVNSEFAKKIVPSSEIPEEPAVLIENWCNDFTELFKDNFLKAAKVQDVQQLTLMFKMFPMVGQNTLGLDLYSKYVCDIIAEESRKIMTGEAKRSGVFAQALLHLFKIVSTIINDHSKIISSCYGMHYMLHVMEKVEKEADLQAGLILDIFAETRKVDRIVKEIIDWNDKDMSNFVDHTNGDANNEDSDYDDENNEEDKNNDDNDGALIEVGDLTNLINEFSQMLQNWSMYSRFFSVRWYEFEDVTDLAVLTPPSPIIDGTFTVKLNKDGYLTAFGILVLHYLNNSFKKTLSLEELPPLNDLITLKPIQHADISSFPVSSVLEDLSLLIRKNLILTVNTGQFQILSNFLDQLAKFYQNEYLVKFMQSKFKSLQPKLTSSLSLRKYVPKTNDPNAVQDIGSRSTSPSITENYATTKLSQLGFNFRGAAASALTNIQSNLQAVVSDEDSVLSLHHYLIYVNTLYMNINFVHRLLSVEILEENPRLLRDNFPFGDNATSLTNKVRACEELIIKQTNKLQKWSVKFLFDSVLMNKIRTLLGNILVNGNENSYVSGAEDFEDLSNMNEFVTRWKATMIPFQNIFHEEAYTELLSLIVEYIVKVLEQRIWSLQVNELGAAKLDRELSLLISTVCSLNYTLREKFTKLTQIVLLLGFDDDDFDVDTGDIKEEIANGINWLLSPKDRVDSRNLKVDKRR